MEQALLDADSFLAAAQSGRTKEAAVAADLALRANDASEKTRAYATLTYLQAGRFNAAKAQWKKLEPSTGSEAAWANAAMAVAFKPRRATEALERLHEDAAGSNEYAILAGVHAMQNRDDETGRRLLDTAMINTHSVFTTAGALGLRRRANIGARARVFQVICGLVGLALLSIVGLLLGLAGAEAFNRRLFREDVTGGAHALMSIETPRERHSGREVARVLSISIAVLVAIAVGIWALVQLT